MKVLHSLIGFLFWLIILAMGVLLIMGKLGINCSLGVCTLTGASHSIILGVIFVALVVIFWITALPVRKEERAVSYECEGGKVSVSVKAINSLLSKLADEFGAIENLHAAISPKDKSVKLDLVVKSGSKIQELSHALQDRVRESMQNNLGISDIGDVKVFVREISTTDDATVKERDNGEWQNM